MVRFVLDDDKVYKVVAESDDAIWVIDYDNPCAPKMVKQDGLVNLEEIPVPDDYMQESVVSRAIYVIGALHDLAAYMRPSWLDNEDSSLTLDVSLDGVKCKSCSGLVTMTVKGYTFDIEG